MARKRVTSCGLPGARTAEIQRQMRRDLSKQMAQPSPYTLLLSALPFLSVSSWYSTISSCGSFELSDQSQSQRRRSAHTGKLPNSSSQSLLSTSCAGLPIGWVFKRIFFISFIKLLRMIWMAFEQEDEKLDEEAKRPPSWKYFSGERSSNASRFMKLCNMFHYGASSQISHFPFPIHFNNLIWLFH